MTESIDLKSVTPSGSEKSTQRRILLAKRKELNDNALFLMNTRINDHAINGFFENKDNLSGFIGKIDAIGVFCTIQNEPDLTPFYEKLYAKGIALALPTVVGRKPLQFVDWKIGEEMQKDSFGVSVPKSRRNVATPPLLLVPCVGFNSKGYRLGYGGGFYDRTLAQIPRPKTLGIAYSFQETDFEAEERDVSLDAVLTENGIRFF